eukprot:COSAG02_NODE_1533_length_12076_cov_2.829173_1_plen_136_part_00
MSRELAESSGLSKPGVGAQEVNACSMRTAGCGHMTQLSPGSRHMAADVRGAALPTLAAPVLRIPRRPGGGAGDDDDTRARARVRAHAITHPRGRAAARARYSMVHAARSGCISPNSSCERARLRVYLNVTVCTLV